MGGGREEPAYEDNLSVEKRRVKGGDFARVLAVVVW